MEESTNVDLSVIEEKLRETVQGVVLTDPRLVRRIIKAHRDISGLVFSIPHAHGYALARDALLALVDPAELAASGARVELLPEHVILLPRPQPREVAKKTPLEVLTRLLRGAFHAQVHLCIEERIARGQLTEAAVRERIDRIGQTEFDEIRAILRHDDLLLPPYGDGEAYAEFAALYLELRQFAPSLVPVTFPGLSSLDHVDEVLAADVEVRALAAPPPQLTAPPKMQPPARAPSPFRAKLLLRAADGARARGNVAQAVLRAARAARSEDTELRAKAEAAVRADIESLTDRLHVALRGRTDPHAPPREKRIATLTELAYRATSRRGLRRHPSARLLYDLERAVRESEEELSVVDMVTWALSRGERPLVRPLPATREVRIARQMRVAAEGLWDVEAASSEPKRLARLLRWASARADENVSAALQPKILEVLTAVGLVPTNAPERIAQYKLVEELLDQAVARGFIHLAHLRDALSKNHLKLDDLGSPRELYEGDPLLRADALLAVALDGVYRRGEIYLRFLQKVSSLAFGTRAGRMVTLYAILPFGGAFVLLEGLGHLVAPLLRAFGLGPVQILGPGSFLATAVVLFGLIHSAIVRRVAERALRIVGRVLAIVFFRIPRWFLTLPAVSRFLRSRAVRVAIRRVLAPLSLTALVVYLTPLASAPRWLSIAGSLGIFALASWASGSRAALLVEDLVLDWLGPTWRTLSGQLLPGLFRMIAGLFRFLLDALERAINRVDQMLRLRRDAGRPAVLFKAGAGLVWFFVAYVVRLYTTLLVEPELNPLKHFPVVTVAHKLLLPVSPEMLAALDAALSPLGPFIGGTIAATTVFLVPSVFGFLVWELKENRNLYRASRKENLHAVRVGHHGETMARLMIPGFHSGTLPKLYDRRRRGAQREETEAEAIRRFREGMANVEEALVRFTERELIALVHKPVREVGADPTARWPHGPLEVESVVLGSNRIRIRIACPLLSNDAFEMAFDEQSGFVVAAISDPGFLPRLSPHGPARTLLENALAGFYHFAGVDLVREQIRAALGPTHYDIADEGLVIWPEETGYRSEVIYPLRGAHGGALLMPYVRGVRLAEPPRPIDANRILFRRQSIAWADWVEAWNAAERTAGPLPRLVTGPSILP
ncbi:hypothetical protein [Pendulispora albinea]|uniref:Uncharacterized protein n=1 Tax=Pendulispora albinea TaxID=2741071 RepID=A0ABZ2M010_9BACT